MSRRRTGRPFRKLWILLLAGCAAPDSTTPPASHSGTTDLDAPVRDVLGAARAAMGDVASIRSVYAAADCLSPGGPYTTIIHSRLPDDVVFDQFVDFDRRRFLVVTRDGAWALDAERRVIGDLDPVRRSIARGHEYHAIALDPGGRFAGGVRRASEMFFGRRCSVIEFADEFGKPVKFYHDERTSLPAGFTMIEPMSEDDAPIVTMFDEWRVIDGVRLFHYARISHRGNEFVFRYTDVRVNDVDGSWFERPDPAPGP